MSDKNNRKEKTPYIPATIKSVMDHAFYDDRLECFIMKDKTYMDLIQINTKDLVSSSDDEVEYDLMKFAKLYKMYADDLKIVVMNFPCKTGKQQEYFSHKLKETDNEIYRRFLQRKLDELVWLEKNDMMREYYYMIFGKKETEIKSNRDLIFNTIGNGKNGLSQKIDKEKKMQICERLNNKCFLVS